MPLRPLLGWGPSPGGGHKTRRQSQELDAIREILTSDGRTLAQGALAWLWARSEQTIPIPGFKTLGQVEENCSALQRGPLTAAQVREVAALLGR